MKSPQFKIIAHGHYEPVGRGFESLPAHTSVYHAKPPLDSFQRRLFLFSGGVAPGYNCRFKADLVKARVVFFLLKITVSRHY